MYLIISISPVCDISFSLDDIIYTSRHCRNKISAIFIRDGAPNLLQRIHQCWLGNAWMLPQMSLHPAPQSLYRRRIGTARRPKKYGHFIIGQPCHTWSRRVARCTVLLVYEFAIRTRKRWNWWHQMVLEHVLVFLCIHIAIHNMKRAYPLCWHAPPNHHRRRKFHFSIQTIRKMTLCLVTNHSAASVAKRDLKSRFVAPNDGVPLSLRPIHMIFRPFQPPFLLHHG